MINIGLLSAVTFLPAVGAVLLGLVPRRHERLLRWGALSVALATFLLALAVYVGFDGDSPDFQFEERAAWMPTLGVGYHLGVDGISLLLVLLTTLLMPVALASAWHAIEDRTKEFVIAMLLLETGMNGTFVALERSLLFSRPRIPKNDRPIQARRGERLAIRSELHGAHSAAMG